MGIGDEVINDFLADNLVASNDYIDFISIEAKSRTIDMNMGGNFKKIKGTLRFELFLEEFQNDLQAPGTLVFSVNPIGALSKMVLPSIKIFQDKLEPYVSFNKNILIVNIYEIIRDKKPEFLQLLKKYRLENLSIEPEMIMINLKKLV